MQNEVHRTYPGREKSAPIPVCVECFQLCHHRDGESLRCDAAEGSSLGMICCLSGKIKMQISDNGQITEYSILAGRLGCYSCPRGSCRTMCTSQECARILKLRFSHTILRASMGHAADFQQDTVPARKERWVGIVRDITPQMNQVIRNLRDALQCRRGTELLILAKAIELLYLHFSSGPWVVAPNIDPRDHKAIQKARFLLTHNLETPPSLSELAAAVGMSVSKLKMLFPKICGMPPYEYLRKIRMQRAMELLHQDGINVTEAAMAVGYSSISHFSKAFHREYTIYPSQIRRRLIDP